MSFPQNRFEFIHECPPNIIGVSSGRQNLISVCINYGGTVLYEIIYLIVILLILFLIYHLCRKLIYEKYLNPLINVSPKNLRYMSMVITGCDSGFGQQFALTFASMGFTVFAYCLTNKGSNNLMKKSQNNNRIHTFIGDITDKNDNINFKNYVFKIIKKNNLELRCLINNAGIMKVGEIDLLDYNDIYESINVNLLGTIHITKLFIPLLRIFRRSRIINICSASSISPMYGYGAYATSKSALETFSIILRAELSAIWKLHVTNILPGAFATNLLSLKNLKLFYLNKINNLRIYNKVKLDNYGENYFKSSINRCVYGTQYAARKNITPVINTCIDAVLRKSPYKRYIVGIDAWFMYLLSWLPLWLNEFIISIALKPLVTPNQVKLRKTKAKKLLLLEKLEQQIKLEQLQQQLN